MTKVGSEITPVNQAGAGKLVMVCGAARSGTTMLDLMLGNSDDAFSTGEIFGYFRPFRQHHFHPVCSCGSEECAVWNGLLDIPESNFHANVFKRKAYNIVVDSSKDLRWVYDSNVWAQKNKLDCFNVVLWKDPLDLAYSYWKRGHNISWYRKVFLIYYERFLDLNLPYFSVNYNRLAADPKLVLQQICDRLGIDCHEGRANFWEKRHHYFFGSAGTAKQVDKGGSSVQNKRDFPREFLKEYESEAAWSENDPGFQKVMSSLQAHDVSLANVEGSAGIRTGMKPLWYYRHILKSVWRKRFPEPWPVVE